jgi:hypothetical protein
MAEILGVIWPTVEAEYFLAKGLTNIWGDLPVGQNQNEIGPQPGLSQRRFYDYSEQTLVVFMPLSASVLVL